MSKVRINPEINIGEILSIVTMLFVAGAFLFGVYSNLDSRVNKNDKRVTVIENNQAVLQEAMLRLEARNNNQFEAIRSHLIRIEDKLDEKADK